MITAYVYRSAWKEAMKKAPWSQYHDDLSDWINSPFIVCQPLSWRGEPTRRICAPERALWCVRQRGSNEECIGSTIPTATGISPGWNWLHRFRPTSCAASKHNTHELVQTHLRRLQRIPLFKEMLQQFRHANGIPRTSCDCYHWPMSCGYPRFTSAVWRL